jgi:hypothetical protein
MHKVRLQDGSMNHYTNVSLWLRCVVCMLLLTGRGSTMHVMSSRIETSKLANAAALHGATLSLVNSCMINGRASGVYCDATANSAGSSRITVSDCSVLGNKLAGIEGAVTLVGNNSISKNGVNVLAIT